MRALAGISHKGGTGRSVTLANVSFHLAVSGLDVCLVDLDLTSPTLGAVLGMTRYEMGAKAGSEGRPRSIVDLLSIDNDPRKSVNNVGFALVDVWNTSEALQQVAPPNRPKFQLLPGRANVDLQRLDVSRVGPLLERLGADFDVVLLDVRSGNSEIANALTSRTVDPLLRSWLLHYRWTHQHLAGIRNFADQFFGDAAERFSGRVKLIRTAVPAITGSGKKKDWIEQYDQSLRAKVRQLPAELQEAELGSIPFDDILLWNETVITQRDLDRQLASPDTFRAFQHLAGAIEQLVGTPHG